jgi:alpha-L-rhamnosidase
MRLCRRTPMLVNHPVPQYCQIKPTNYQGSFSSSDATLSRIWWTGAYTVKVNLLSNYFGSILIDRGDRISWTGDAHTSQAAALVSLANYNFILNNIDRTACPTCSNGALA